MYLWEDHKTMGRDHAAYGSKLNEMMCETDI